jgi:hypothetical protein
MGAETKKIFALETLDAGTFVVPAGEYGVFEAAEADRLIAVGAAVDPDKKILTDAEIETMVADGGVTAEVDGEIVDVVEIDLSGAPDAESEPAKANAKKAK